MKNQELFWAKVDSFLGNYDSAALTYHRPCPICGSLKFKVILELNNFQFYSDSAAEPKRLDVKENMCLDCGALYMNPCYSDYGFRILFAEAGQSYGSTEGRPREQIEWLNARGLLNEGSLVLDVGCYDGCFLARLPDHVLKVGIDIDEPAIERGRLMHDAKNIDFIQGDFETFEFSYNTPSLITMFHVLEHLPRPTEVLKKLRSISSSNTRLIVEVPILEDAITNDINGFFSVMHLTHFSKNSLSNCLKAAGWTVTDTLEHADYNGYRILAVPTHDQNNVMLLADLESLILVQRYLASWYENLASVNLKLSIIKDFDYCVIWGAGLHTEFLYHCATVFKAKNRCNYIVVDNDESKHGLSWRGLTIYPPDILEGVDWSRTCLIVSSYGGQPSMVKSALERKVPEEKIIKIYDFLRGRKIAN
jgi:ubiquinone/menaquinone biosynthesis C-methylase UbiE